MKYRNLAIISIILLAVVGIAFSNFEFKEKRYHQHLEAKVRPEDVVTTDEFATHLPIIDIKTEAAMPPSFKERKDESGEIIKERNYDVVKSSVKYIQNEDTENKRGDTPVFTTNAYIRTRGASSRNFEKKGYWIEFKNDDFSKNRDIEIDGMVADSDWVLHGPYLDKTLIRNYLCYNIAGEFMDYSPNVRFCELFINDEYRGLYLLTEKIKYNKDGRVNITKTDPKMSKTSYIIKMDRPINDKKYRVIGLFESMEELYAKYERVMEILYPNETLTEKQRNSIEKDIIKVEKAIISRNIVDRNDGYKSYIDVDSFVDYYILNEFTANADATTVSTYLYKDIRGKIKLITWDHNSSFDNYEFGDIMDRIIFDTSWWYKYLLKDEYFTNKVIDRYKYLRKNVLSDEYLMNYIDETIEYLGPAIDRNYKRWPNALKFDNLKPKERNQHSHDEAIGYLKNAIKRRGAYLDKNIDTLKGLSHKSMIKK